MPKRRCSSSLGSLYAGRAQLELERRKWGVVSCFRAGFCHRGFVAGWGEHRLPHLEGGLAKNVVLNSRACRPTGARKDIQEMVGEIPNRGDETQINQRGAGRRLPT